LLPWICSGLISSQPLSLILQKQHKPLAKVPSPLPLTQTSLAHHQLDLQGICRKKGVLMTQGVTGVKGVTRVKGLIRVKGVTGALGVHHLRVRLILRTVTAAPTTQG
jgi:hypothetical protein